MESGLDYKKSFDECWEDSFVWGRPEVCVRVLDPLAFIPSVKTNFSESVNTGIIEGEYKGETVLLVVNEEERVSKDFVGNYPIIRCPQSTFNLILEKNFGHIATLKSEIARIIHKENKSAHLLNKNYIKYVFILAILSSVYLPIKFGIIGLLANTIYFIQNIFKLLCFIFAKYNKKKERFTIARIDFDSLPIYTIIIPLYKEAGKLKKISNAIEKLRYPREKLDIKIVIESTDTQTAKGIYILDLERRYHILRVPKSLIRTKPRACNYAMQFAYGEFVVIYDAEDVPEPLQLLKAVHNFNKLGDEYVCLQAKLEIDPSFDDRLSQMFALEYEMWFGYLLPGMSKLGFPITLGGTSNHFRASFLREVGLWDPYNVTEDAELGIRIDLFGKKVSMLDSTTCEEGQLFLLGWVEQRMRWIKGFMVTFFVFLISNKKKQKLINTLSVFIFLGFSTYSFLIAPVVFYSGLIGLVTSGAGLFSALNTILFVCCFWTFAYYGILSTKEDDPKKFWKTVLLFPLYFGLHSLAAYLSILELFFSPFRWNKTDHRI